MNKNSWEALSKPPYAKSIQNLAKQAIRDIEKLERRLALQRDIIYRLKHPDTKKNPGA